MGGLPFDIYSVMWFGGWLVLGLALVLGVRLSWGWWRMMGAIGCGRCGYDLRGHGTAADGLTCPECGAKQSVGDMRRPARWRRTVLLIVLCSIAGSMTIAGSRMARDGVFCLLPDWALIWLVERVRPDRESLLIKECEYRLTSWDGLSDQTLLLRAILTVDRSVREAWPRGYPVYLHGRNVACEQRHVTVPKRQALLAPVQRRFPVLPVPLRTDYQPFYYPLHSTFDRTSITGGSWFHHEVATASDEFHGLIYLQTRLWKEQPTLSNQATESLAMMSIPMRFVESIDEVIQKNPSTKLSEIVRTMQMPSIAMESTAEGAAEPSRSEPRLTWQMPSNLQWPDKVAYAFRVELRRGDGKETLDLTRWHARRSDVTEPIVIGLLNDAIVVLQAKPPRPGDKVVITGDQALALRLMDATMYWAGEVAWPAEEVFKSLPVTPVKPASP